MKTPIIALLLLSTITNIGQSAIIVTDEETSGYIGQSVSILEDPTNSITFEEVLKMDFPTIPKLEVPNLGVSNSTYWIKFKVVNNTTQNELLIDLEQSSLDEISFYESKLIYHLTDRTIISERPVDNQNYVLPIKLEPGQSSVYFLAIKSGDQIQIPIVLGTRYKIQHRLAKKDMYFGFYTGIMFAIILTAILIFIKTKDKNYFLYVGYIAIVLLTQANFQGYTLRYVWPSFPEIERYSVYILSALAGITGSLFIMNYVGAKKNAKWSMKFFYTIFSIYPFVVLPVFFGFFNFSYNVLQLIATFSAFVVLYISWYCWRKGVQQSGNLLVAWGIFMIGIVLFVLKDFGIVPYNVLTYNTMTIGSALEGILLSFGLADKINILKKEKEQAQKREIEALRVNEKELESRVVTRTIELEKAEQKATKAYQELVVSQKQLVESEKLAGLGQMTAGIAHELNNPINFVSSNVGPLQRDVQDIIQILDEFAGLPPDTNSQEWKEVRLKYDKMQIPFVKKEIEMLLKGIEEGSQRTAEIVRGMRIFARADKDTLVPANINDCINSTLVVMKSVLKNQVTLERSIDMNIPTLECYPGKLNQAIVNLVSNAVQATKMNRKKIEDRVVEVKSYHTDDSLFISIKDNGPGISDDILDKIFDPFFTTKQVGEGTGLGLSIAMGIAEEHGGRIEVITEIGKGSEFIIHLPRKQKFGSRTAA